MADRTHTVDWSGLGDDDDDDQFFESSDRTSSVVPLNLASSDDDEFCDSRMSFTAARPSVSLGFPPPGAAASAASSTIDYGMWMEEPGSIQERRKRLLQGMGLNSGKNFIRLASVGLRAPSTKIGNCEVTPVAVETRSTNIEEGAAKPPMVPMVPLLPLVPVVHERSRSEGNQDALSSDSKQRQKDLLGDTSKESLTRTSSSLSKSSPLLGNFVSENEGEGGRSLRAMHPLSSTESEFGAVFFIKNLDTGKEFLVSEIDSDGMWNRLSDIQTGKQLTMEEFEKSVGYSPVVKELMRRQNVGRIADGIGGSERKPGMNSYISKSFRFSKRRGVALLKNIKGVANSFINEKDRENTPLQESKPTKSSSSVWIKARQHGKSYRELTALHLCQEIQAHEGSIWTIRFSSDGRYLASAGEDKVIHVWEAQECAATSAIKPPDEFSSFNPSSDKPPLPETPKTTEKKKKGKTSPSSSRKGNQIPDYIHMPETVFTLLDTPVCSFKGHLDDVLDLSWSRSQLLLSSSMDKTVRLWDMETKSCLKLFAHNDYVTCIQFNPTDDKYFISGSLDAKVRIWNIPNRQVVDWTDFHEMVTAACYTPDGQGAIIGSHQGSCRMYGIEDGKLSQKAQIDIQNKKKAQAKKITGFQFVPGKPSEVLITSADSQHRIFDGTDLIHKFRGFRNTSSQIAASFSQDGKYVISASEDSQVYVWRREEVSVTKGKNLVTTRSHENFPSKDVSVAIPWPGRIKGDPPVVQVHSKKHSKQPVAASQEDGAADGSTKGQLPPIPKKNSTVLERVGSCQEEESTSSLDPGIGSSESFSSSSSSISYGDSPSISSSTSSMSSSWSSSWSWFDGNNHGSHTVEATAWGLVIVTAGVGGEIRAYQNFGVPLRMGRQRNI